MTMFNSIQCMMDHHSRRRAFENEDEIRQYYSLFTIRWNMTCTFLGAKEGNFPT